MFTFQHAAAEDSRARGLRELYRRFSRENTPNFRGLALLRRWLSREQCAQFDAYGYFDVVGSDSGKRYRIQYGTAANVRELDDRGIPKIGFCFVPMGELVAGDVMLAQKIALETNERDALAVATKFLGPFQTPV
jgi:hypothetical protein